MFPPSHHALTGVYILATLSVLLTSASAISTLQVDTTVGKVHGLINGTHPNVAQFLNIPFAEPPVGPLRWAPPIPKSPVAKIDATRFGPACSQYVSKVPSTYSIDAREFLVDGEFSEDCLSLSVWAPFTVEKVKGNGTCGKLPVVVWFYGGDHQNGGAQVKYQQPAPWVQRSREFVFVQVNYRLNIFGNPGAAGLDISGGANYGLLDQRLALEWVRSNIANFWGDPSKITLFGQSAGAGSADFYNFAYPHDPIISGLILSSVSAISSPGQAIDPTHSNFTFVAGNFGCGNLSAGEEVACMRKVNDSVIVEFLKEYQDNFKQPPLEFYPVVDNVTVFGDYIARAKAGNFTKVPAIHGTLNNEDSTLQEWIQNGATTNLTIANKGTVRRACAAVLTSQYRYAANATTFRYYYTGNFSNISPRPWQGAYHASELPLIFGTHDIARGPSTAFEIAISNRMQDLWLAFMKDPVKGLPAQGWPAYVEGGSARGNAIEFAWEGVVERVISTGGFEANCEGVRVLGREGAVPVDSRNFGVV